MSACPPFLSLYFYILHLSITVILVVCGHFVYNGAAKNQKNKVQLFFTAKMSQPGIFATNDLNH